MNARRQSLSLVVGASMPCSALRAASAFAFHVAKPGAGAGARSAVLFAGGRFALRWALVLLVATVRYGRKRTSDAQSQGRPERLFPGEQNRERCGPPNDVWPQGCAPLTEEKVMANSETTPKQDEIRMLSEAEIAAVDGGSVGEVIDAVAGGMVTAFRVAGAFLGWLLHSLPGHAPGGGHD